MSIYDAVLEYVTGKSEIEIPFPAKDIQSNNGCFHENNTIGIDDNKPISYIQEE